MTRINNILNDVPISERKTKKTSCGKICCRLTICLLIFALILIGVIAAIILIAWFTLGSVLWDVAFAVDIKIDCDEFRSNSPTNYTINYRCPYFIDPTSQWPSKLAPYYVDSSYLETVSFKSRDASWIEGGVGKANIVGTLYKQPVINATSKFIVSIHGYRVCRYRYETTLPSTMLYKMGYNILQIDLRNHGDSGLFSKLPYVTFGSFEHLDALGAVDYLQERYPFLGNNSFGLFGTSMGGATSLVAFAKDKRFKVAFVDSPPCDVYQTLYYGAQAIAGNSLADVAMNSIRSVLPVKAPLMGFPPFYNDPKELLSGVDLSNGRKLFFLHIEDDIVVPTFNFYTCRNATMKSITNNGYPVSSMESFLGTVDYPFSNRTRSHCNKHLAYQFLNLDSFYNMLSNFFTNNL